MRWLPVSPPTESLDDIDEDRDLEGLFATSGQPEERQFDLIRDAGFETLINLTPSSVLENSLKDEPTVVADLGLEYVHSPVDFKDPTEDDFRIFVDAIDARADLDAIWESFGAWKGFIAR